MGQGKRIIDYVGMRQGRVTIIRQLETYRGQHHELLCRCDCGNVFTTTVASICNGSPRSCGCARATRGSVKFKCPSCGRFFNGSWEESPKQQFCPECAQKYKSGIWRVCAVCKHLFQGIDAGNDEACSPECSEQWRKRVDADYINELIRKEYESAGLSESLFAEQADPQSQESEEEKHPGVYQYGKRWKVFTMYHGKYKYCASFDNRGDAIRCSEMLRNCADDSEKDALLSDIKARKIEYKGKKKALSMISFSSGRDSHCYTKHTTKGKTYYMVYRCIDKKQTVVGYFPTLEEAQQVAKRAKEITAIDELLKFKAEVKATRRKRGNAAKS